MLADEHRVVLAYCVSDEFLGVFTDPPVEPSGHKRDVFAVIRLDNAVVHKFGYPNDEAIAGHPLHGSGLKCYSVAEVIDSPWRREIEQQHRVHPRHQPGQFQALRHLIFTFHDSTFECLCRTFKHKTLHGTLEDLTRRMTDLLRR